LGRTNTASQSASARQDVAAADHGAKAKNIGRKLWRLERGASPL